MKDIINTTSNHNNYQNAHNNIKIFPVSGYMPEIITKQNSIKYIKKPVHNVRKKTEIKNKNKFPPPPQRKNLCSFGNIANYRREARYFRRRSRISCSYQRFCRQYSEKRSHPGY